MRKTLVPLIFLLLLLTSLSLIAVVYSQNDSCRETIHADGVTNGTWSSDCESEDRRGNYARFYTFTQPAQSQVTITLESLNDTYLYVRPGTATSGTSVNDHDSDDDAGGGSNSQAQETLSAGTYTIEATTFLPGETGNFTLTISGIAATGDTQPTAMPPTPVTITPGVTPTLPGLSQVVARVRPSVVKIVNDESGGQGSGAIIQVDSDGTAWIVTNEHVVKNTLTATVTVGDSVQHPGRVIGVDPDRDLAVLSINCRTCQAIRFGDSDLVNVGDQVFAVGYPVDRFQPRAVQGPVRVIVPGQATVTQGIVSAFRYETEKDRRLVQTDTPMSGGNSGGPLLSMDGLIIGVNTQSIVVGYSQNLNYAVLETTVQEQLPMLMSGASPPKITPPTPTFVPYALPLAGHIHHDPTSKFFSAIGTGISERAFVAEVLFVNPYDGASNPFSYGFRFTPDDGSPPLHFWVHSSGEWGIDKLTPNGYDEIAEGRTTNLSTSDRWGNRLLIGMVGQYGFFSLNGEWLAGPDGRDIILIREAGSTGNGALSIINGYVVGSQASGAITHYERLKISSIFYSSSNDTRADANTIRTAWEISRSNDAPPAQREHPARHPSGSH